MQNADRTIWQHEEPYAKQPTKQDSDSYWRDELSGAPLSIALPIDRPPSSIESFRGARLDSRLPEDLVAGLEEMSLRENQTLQITLLATFQMLLLRYSGQEDIVVVSHIDNGSEYNTSDPNSLFGDGLLLRTDLSGNPRFRELLKRVESVVGQACAHRAFHYEKLMEELFPGRHPEDRLLYPVGYVFTERGTQPWNPVEQSEYVGEEEVRRCYLTLCASEDQQGLRVSFEYNREVFDESRIGRMLGHLQVLLEGVVADPELRLSEFQILRAEEREQILVEWNHTRTEYLRGKTIHQLFELQASDTPDARAIVFEGVQLTYRELNERANQLAHYLQKLGVGPEVMVGICVERSLEMVVGLLGILKAGGAYVPLDLAYPPERVSFILQDALAPVLLTQERLLENLPAHGAQTVCLDRDWKTISEESRENPKGEVGSNNLAYIIYTSGSTGRPKGVAIEHHSTVALVEWARAVFSEEELKGVLASTSICFDLSIFELFVTLSRGGAIIMAQDALQLMELDAANEVTLINTVPSAVAELVRVGGIPATVRTVNLAGEPLAQSLVEQIYEQESIQRVFDLYGPSEDTTYSTYALRRQNGRATIGRPIANTQVYILDKEMQPVPIGMAGELHLGGEGLARGYLNRPELTREKFIANSFSDDPTARLYKTGDLARYLADGNIEFLGRIDHQVKVRGYRIELGEIETALEGYPGIEKSVVMAREDQPGNKRLVAYLVPRGQETFAISEVRSYLMQHLPEYMVPAFFVVLEKLPLTPNGKIDRRALPIPDATRPALEGPSVAPRDSTEFQLVSIWEKLLKVQPIGVKDNFFELGGDSLLAVRLFAQIKEIFGESLHLATLFRAPTIEQLARIIDQEGGSEGWPSLVAIQPGGSKPPLYCAHACGGNVLIYRTMARYLNRLIPDQPIYGLQAQGLDGKGTPLGRIEDMAAHYIKEVRAHQPEGPYYLFGDTWGGLIVFEMAQQLHRQGQRVALLAMLDTICRLPPTRIRRMRDHIEHLLQSGPKRYAQAAAKGIKSRFMRRVQENGNHSVTSVIIKSDSSNDDPLQRTMDAIDQAHLEYVPARRSYPGKITYFYARDNRYVNPSDDNRMEWKRVVKGLDVHVIPGRHDTIRDEPHVEFFAEELATCLQAAQSSNSFATAATRETIPSGYHPRLKSAERAS